MNFEKISFPEKYNGADRFIDSHVNEGRGDNVAIYYFDQKITYKQLQENVNRVGNALRSLGLEHENRVMVLTMDCPQFIYSIFGAQKIGAVPIGTNTMLTTKDYLYILNDSRAKAIIVSNELYSNIEAIKDELKYVKNIIVVSDKMDGSKGDNIDGTLDFDSWISGFSAECETADTTPDEMAFMLYSSGTTGAPKGIAHSHYSMAYSAECVAKGLLQMTENDITYSVARLFFGYGFQNSMGFPLYVGAATVLDPGRPLPEHLMGSVSRYKPTMFFGVPTSYNQLLQIPDLTTKFDLSSLRVCLSAGEPLPGAVWQKWTEVTGIEILDCLGSTELLHFHIGNPIGKSRPDTSGLPIPGYECKLVDENGNEVPRGEQGTLLVKGGSMSIGYWNKIEKTRDAYQGWWLNTGDTYMVNEEGYWVFCGRGDDMIKAGGIWVSPAEVESTIMLHPAVLECGVVGVPDQDGLFKPKAFIAFKEGVTVTEDLKKEIQKFVKTTIAPFKFPRWIKEVKELPKTPTGKIKRYMLREMDKGEINIDKKDR